MPEKPEEFYSQGAEEFAKNQSIENMPQDYLDLLDKFIDAVDSGKVLDAGCGPGRDVEYFIENGLEAIGVDLAEGMIEHAEKNKKGEYHLMNIRNLGFKDNEFNGVWCNTVMQFFPPEEMQEVISELDRVLKPEGVLYISFKAGDGTAMREEYGENVKNYLIPEQEARKMLEKEDYTILETDSAEINDLKVLNLICRKKD